MYDFNASEPHGTTSFPTPLGLAASFNLELVHAIADAIAEEARAKSNIYLKETGTLR